MKKIKLKILGISYSQSQIGSFVLVLSERKGDKRKLPCIIKQNDAQYLTLKMEGITTPRPLTHDLLKNVIDTLGATVEEVFIHSLVEGVFYVKLILRTVIDTYELDCMLGDGVSMALAYKCVITVSEDIMKSAGIYMDDDGTMTDDQNEKNHEDRPSTVSVDSLEAMLQKAIDNDEFEVAAQLRDRINELKAHG
jgi:hypothetical protein